MRRQNVDIFGIFPNRLLAVMMAIKWSMIALRGILMRRNYYTEGFYLPGAKA